jgi:hypothetical protein
MYGPNKCNECVYWEKCTPHNRCHHINNFADSYHFLGPVFITRPESRNWRQKCEWFIPIKEERDGRNQNNKE